MSNVARENVLARLDAIQRRSRERLESSGTSRALLVELLEASCLLELAKLEATHLDPATYLQLAVDVVAHMYPVAGVAATVTMPGARAVDVHAGEGPPHSQRFPLVTSGETIGVLSVGDLNVDLASSDEFLGRVATQVAQGLAAAMHAEQLRRDAATATAARIASELADAPVGGVAERFEELVLSLASFPSVVAAELAVEHPVIGPPLRLRSGYWETDGLPHSVESITVELGNGRLTARLRSGDATTPDEESVHAVLQSLAGSLARIAQTTALREQAETDVLTGLGNRRRLQRTLDYALGRAERYHEHVALLLIDLDRFKPVNDELGHETGDAVLVACAQAMKRRARSYDEVVRLGGDEFVVVAPVPDVLDALRLADDVRDEIANSAAALLPPGWGLTATIGVSMYPDAGQDRESLLRAADVALYRAKDAGRNSVVVADPPPHPAGGMNRLSR